MYLMIHCNIKTELSLRRIMISSVDVLNNVVKILIQSDKRFPTVHSSHICDSVGTIQLHIGLHTTGPVH